MRGIRNLFCKSLLVLLAGCVIISSTGCQEDAVQEIDSGPVLFPAPPNKPRLQFLRSYSGGEDFDVPKAGFLENFVLGEDEISAGTILKPYGVEIHKGKIYVCDVGQSVIEVLDIENNTFSLFPTGRSVQGPINMHIEPDGTKYIADYGSGAIAVFNADDKLVSFLGKELDMQPRDVTVRGKSLYLTDAKSNQVLELDKRTGQLIRRIGKKVTDMEQWAPDEFAFITDLGLDSEGNIYVSDKLKSRVTIFDPEGVFLRSIGRRGNQPDSLVRAKSIAFDKEDRMWVVDAGPASAVKIFRNDGQVLMYFGNLGTQPGQMYLPASVTIDYDHVDLFKKYAMEGAEIEFIVLVTNQFGDQKVSVYGYGTFPELYPIQEREDPTQ